MGSQKQDERELTVLVTGFGPFREEYPVNPSFEIAKGLPPYLPPLRSKDSTPEPALPPVRIVTHPEAIRVNYAVVRELVPSFWDGDGKYDFVIHIGMAGPNPVYQIEHRAHRRGYRMADVDGLEPDEGDDDGRWVWRGLPDEITTELDIVDVHRRWMGHSLVGRTDRLIPNYQGDRRVNGQGEANRLQRDMDLRISEDPGRYLCDFIYYSSLAHLYKQGRERKVLFLHVPADASGEAIARGRELAVNLVRAIAESEVARRVMNESQS